MAAQCPTKKTKLLRGVDQYNRQEESAGESEGESEREIESEDAYPCEGDLLIVRRLQNDQPSDQHES